MREDQLPTAPPFDPDVDAFDPERAGFDKFHPTYFIWKGGSLRRGLVRVEFGDDDTGGWMNISHRPDPSLRIKGKYIEIDLYSGKPLTHSLTLAILRANGWEG